MDSNSQEIDILRELEKVNQDLQGKIRQDPKIMQSVTKPKVGFTDFRKLLDETNQSVRPIIEAFCESYVTNQNMLDPKVQQRLNIDSIALSEILWKKAVSDVAVIQIMERIDSGDDDYKMYAALSSILGTKNNLPKELLQTIMVLEKNYKDLKSELFEQEKLSIENTENVNSESLKFRGTKNLLMAIKNATEIEETRKTLEEEQRIIETTEQKIDVIKLKYEDNNEEEQNSDNPL